MMSVVLVAIGTALALPSYRDMVEKRQVTNGAEQLSAFINTAQGIAQGLNRKVNVSYEPYGDDEWCIGMAEDDALCDCENSPESCLINGQQYVINSSHAGNRTMMHSVTGATHAFYIDPVRGLTLPCKETEELERCIDKPLSELEEDSAPPPLLDIELRSPSGDFRLNLLVNYTGRIILCSEQGHEIPGYEVCPP
jgi:Tfp pilus assembly major pilin PilA